MSIIGIYPVYTQYVCGRTYPAGLYMFYVLSVEGVYTISTQYVYDCM